jgi:hypothetical protein
MLQPCGKETRRRYPGRAAAAHLCGACADELGAHARQNGRQRGLQQAAKQRDVAHGAQLGEGELQAEGEEQQLHAQLRH